MVFGQPGVGRSDRLGLLGDSGQILPRNCDVQFVLSHVGVDAVADTSRAGDDAVGEGGGERHARRAAPKRNLRAHTRAHGGLVQEHHASGPTREEHHVRLHRRVCEGRVDHDARWPGQAGDPGNLLHLEIADPGHERERLVELLAAVVREGEVMRVTTDRAVVMVARDGVEGPSARRDPPEAAPGGLRSCELRYSDGRRLPERDRDWTPREAESVGEPHFYDAIVGHPILYMWGYMWVLHLTSSKGRQQPLARRPRRFLWPLQRRKMTAAVEHNDTRSWDTRRHIVAVLDVGKAVLSAPHQERGAGDTREVAAPVASLHERRVLAQEQRWACAATSRVSPAPR